jgi:hypothetical protein
MSDRVRRYTDLARIRSFEERYRYLQLHSSVGVETFGFDRWINQLFYTSSSWRRVRNEVIARDRGCDLGVEGYDIHDKVHVHHMNPMTIHDIEQGMGEILDPEFLICASFRTHNAIHYGDEKLLVKPPVVRKAGDTKLW